MHLEPLKEGITETPGANGTDYRTFFERVPLPAWILGGASLHILDANPAAILRFGYSREEFQAMTLLNLHPEEDAARICEQIRYPRNQAGDPSAMVPSWRLRTRPGHLIDVDPAWGPITIEGRPAVLLVVSVSDQSPRRLLRELLHDTELVRDRLGALSHQLLTVQEEERRKIARELHDEVGQLLTGLKLLIGRTVHDAQPELGLRETARFRLEEITHIVDQLIGRIRDLSMNLRPPMLDEIGLGPALLWYFERYTARTAVRVQFRQAGANNRLAPAVEIAAFRIIQEALTNVARHAHAAEVEVTVNATQRKLKLRVEDKGAGFDQASVPAGQTAGLTGMKERALLLGGQCTIDTTPGSGTCLTAELPIRENEDPGFGS